MIRILVLGGYGGFGARVVRRLVSNDHDVLVGGRNLAKAKAFCASDPRLTAMAIDRNQDLRPILQSLRPDILVDAAGPFQQSGHAVVDACLDAGIHYLDLADGRAFVSGIGQFDERARQAGIAVVSGASSVPALSGAVVRALADGMDHVSAVEMAISASNRATAGASVAAAILSYVGKPIALWRGRRRNTGYGWQELRRVQIAVTDGPRIKDRLVALADVPDLELLPDRLPGKPAVSFHAGTELALQNLTLWAASWLVRWGWIRSLSSIAALLEPLRRLTARLGTDRSGMIVSLFGQAGCRRVERRWSLIASNGDGPEIPALAVPLLVDAIAAGKINAGACDAGQLLSLDDFEPDFRALAIRHERSEIEQPPALYHRVMGSRFNTLPKAVRAIHDVLRDGGAHGRATVTVGHNPFARLIARIMGFPSPGDHELHVHFCEVDGIECWKRSFSGKRFSSRLRQRGEQIEERFGPLAFIFDLPSDDRGLTMVMRSWRLGPIPLPLVFAPRSLAREWEEDGLFHFDVPIALPLIGMVVHYQGRLRPSQ